MNEPPALFQEDVVMWWAGQIQDSCIPTSHVCFLITGSQVRQYANKIW